MLLPLLNDTLMFAQTNTSQQLQGITQTNQRATQQVQMQATASLDADELQRIDEILMHWEKRGEKVRQYECKFLRLEYDPVFGPADRNTPKRKSWGVIRYQAPDKGMFRVDEIADCVMTGKPGEQPAVSSKEGPIQRALGVRWQIDISV